MSKTIKLRKGLDIKLVGAAEKKTSQLALADRYGIAPDNFIGVTPKLLVKVDEKVKAGSPLFFDKNRPEVIFTSPVSGTVVDIVRGEKRKILEVIVQADAQQEYETFDVKSLNTASKDDVVQTLLKSGLWTSIIQRPYGIIANPSETPKAIFISGFDTAPLAPDMNYALEKQLDNLNKGVEVLKKLTPGKVHLSINGSTTGVMNQVNATEKHTVIGPHPAGNVGVQIHHIDPINKGEVVWTVDVQNLAIIGRLFNTGKVDMTKTIAVTGSEIEKPSYVTLLPGMPMRKVLEAVGVRKQKEGESVRVINGNVLTGVKSSAAGYVGFYNNQISAIPEGDKYEFVGWAMPRFNKFSVSRVYFSWLMPGKKYNLDTNLNGGPRPFILSGLYEKYLPMDIYPVYLLKAILAGDIDKMENLGIYEVIEDDFALCEFVDPSKNNIQQIIREGINLMIKELN